MQHVKGGKIVGENIRRIRTDQRLTQQELATRLQLAGLDISRGTLAKIEAGIRHISCAELKNIKNILQMTYDDFFKE